MKRLLIIALTILSVNAIAQTNNYPTIGDVTIYNYSPSLILQRNTADGGFTEGIQTRLHDGTDNWYFGALHTGQWVVSKGNYANAKMVVLDNGNVGIGTIAPASKLDLVDNNQHLTFLLNQKLVGAWPASIDATTMTIQSSGASAGNLAFATGNSEVVRITANSYVGIGTTNPAYKLDVLGTIRAKEVLVNLDGGADFVFEKGYKLLPIEHVADYVQENKHLPDIPSANEMVKNGVSMGDMQVKLLQKVEEQTLYIIGLNNELQDLKKQLKELQNKK